MRLDNSLLALVLAPLLALSSACGDDSEPAPDTVVAQDSGPGADVAITPDTASAPDITIRPDAPPPSGNCNPAMVADDACGGELVGDWSYQEACIDGDALLSLIKTACPTATISGYNVQATAASKWNFTATNYQIDVATHVGFDLNVPADCATSLGGCATVQTLLETALASVSGTATCSGDDACVCPLDFLYEIQGSGTYTAADGKVTLENGDEYYYCVEDGELRYSGVLDEADDDAAGYVLVPTQQ